MSETIIYISYIRSQLEYASLIWSPFTECNIQKIERVQNKFLRTIEYKMKIPHSSGNYRAILNITNLKSLHSRRIINDLCFLYQLVNNDNFNPVLRSYLNFNLPKGDRSLRKQHLFNLPNYNSSYLCNFPIYRIQKLANDYNKNEWFNLLSAHFVSFKKDLISNIN